MMINWSTFKKIVQNCKFESWQVKAETVQPVISHKATSPGQLYAACTQAQLETLGMLI